MVTTIESKETLDLAINNENGIEKEMIITYLFI
jgi:hypothetical protein